MPDPLDHEGALPDAQPPRYDTEREALDRLLRVGGERLVHDLAALYLEQSPERLAAAQAAVGQQDAEALARAVHGLKSSSAQLGAHSLASACEATEHAAEHGDLRTAYETLGLVISRYQAFSEWLSAHATDPAGGGRGVTSSPSGSVIAVIEDNADNRLLVDAILGERFVLQEYANGAEALAGLRARRPDLVLLDVSLPGMDGPEVLANIRGDPGLREIPVIALTAHAMRGDRERYLALGFDEYVAKPIVDEEALVEVIERLLARSRTDARQTRDAGEPA
jgi:CheY-like chemotaxis protein/HPt (histidine-containing phosphotransfer) domain-containing protein